MKTGISLPLPFLAEIDTAEEGTNAMRQQGLDPDSFLDTLKKKGVHSIELRYFQKNLKPDSLKKVFGAIIKRGMSVTIHGDIEPEHGAMPILESLPWIGTYMEKVYPVKREELMITMHPVRISDNNVQANHDRTVEILRHLCREIEREKLPVRIAYENQRDRGGPNPAIAYSQMVGAAMEADSPRLGLCWDMGHAWSNHRRSIIEECPPASFLKMTIHTHIHDLLPGTDSTHWPLDRGTVPVAKFVRLLVETGYAGVYNLELSPEKFMKEDILSCFLKSIDILSGAAGSNALKAG